MVRRSTVDRSPQSAEHGAGYETGTEHLEPGAVGRSRPSRGPGAAPGGRWLVWLFRGVAWAVLLLIGYRGVAAIVTGETQSAAARRHRRAPGTRPARSLLRSRMPTPCSSVRCT